MTTGELLRALLNISDMKQKDFAKIMYSSPSKISKIISGKLSVAPTEAKSFSEQAARIFADELYDNNCYFKFKDIFPIIFDFTSRFDLNDFLFSAFQYAIEEDREAAEDPSGRSHKNKYYSGHKQVLYMYSIILSDYLKRDRDQILELYSALQQSFGYFAELQARTIILPPEIKREIILYQFFDPDHLDTIPQDYISNFLGSLFETELYTDLYRWELKFDANKPFLLAKDKFIMLFDKQIDGTPQLTLIRNPSELDHFYDLIIDKTKEARCMTYSSNNIQDFFDSEIAKNDNSLLAEKLKVILSTTYEGYKPNHESDQVSDFYDNLLKGGTSIFMSADSIESFMFKSEVIVPYFSTVDLDLQDRIDYLARIRDYVESVKPAPVFVINTQLNSLSLLIDKKWSMVSLVHPSSQSVKHHIFASSLIGPELEKAALESGINITDYIDRLIAQSKSQKH